MCYCRISRLTSQWCSWSAGHLRVSHHKKPKWHRKSFDGIQTCLVVVDLKTPMKDLRLALGNMNYPSGHNTSAHLLLLLWVAHISQDNIHRLTKSKVSIYSIWWADLSHNIPVFNFMYVFGVCATFASPAQCKKMLNDDFGKQMWDQEAYYVKKVKWS